MTEKSDCGCDLSDIDGVTRLQMASALGKLHVVDTILRHHGNCIDTANKLGWTPLMHAARNGHSVIVRKLIAHGANIFMTNRYGMNLLSLAVASGDPLTVITVIEAMSTQVNYTQLTTSFPLIIASLYGDVSIVKLLLSHNCDPNSASPLGLTSLMMAAAVGDSTVANVLLLYGANKHALNYLKQSALDIAIFQNHGNIISLLTDQRHTCGCSLAAVGLVLDTIATSCVSKQSKCSFNYSPFRNSQKVELLQGEIISSGKMVQAAEVSTTQHVLLSTSCTSQKSPKFYKNVFPMSPISHSFQPCSASNTEYQISKPCCLSLPSSPVTKHMPTSNSWNVSSPSFASWSPSPSKCKLQFKSSKLSPQQNFSFKKISPITKRYKYCVQKKNNVTSNKSSSDQLQYGINVNKSGSREKPFAMHYLSPRCNTTPIKKEKRSVISQEEKSPSWKNIYIRRSPESACSPKHQSFSVPRYISQTVTLEAFLRTINLGEFSELFSAHELDIDTFLTLNEKDLEDIGINNKEVQRSILNKILQLNST